MHSDEGRPAPRFPLIALLAPLVVSAVLFLVLRSGYVLVFALLGPVMALSSWWEARRAHRVETERQREQARARDEEDYQSRVQRDQHHLALRQQQFPHPSQWVNLPLWRPQHSNAGPSIRIGTTTQNGPHGTPLVGLPVVAEIPDAPHDALVVTDHEGEMTLAQAHERFFDVERAYRLRRLVLVGRAGESPSALRLPPVPPSTPPQGWLLGPGYVSLVNCEGLGAFQDRVDRDRVDS